MRLGTLGMIASSLLAMAGIALAQPEPNDAPLPPAPTRPLPEASPTPAPIAGPAQPAWQAPPGGYGGCYGGWGDGCHSGCCDSYSSCCNTCRPGLMCRIKALKSRLCAAIACRRACRSSCCSSCCSSCGSSCCGSDMIGHDMATGTPQMLPMPPAEPTPYSSSDDDEDDDSLDDDTARRPAVIPAPIAKQHYTMPRMTSARRTMSKTKTQRKVRVD